MSNNVNSAVVAPSKSDTASSWRRGGNNNSVLSGNRAVSSPSVKVTPPPSEDRTSPPPAIAEASSPVTASGPKFRPQPLRFSAAVSQSLPTVAFDNADEDTDGETQSSGSSVKSGASNSSPTTPRSSSSNEMPLSPREEASKRLYEGLGIGRPVSATPSDQGQINPTVSVAAVNHRMVSQPTRQPRGPPSGADELGPKNFATRIRRKAIGGLGMLHGCPREEGAGRGLLSAKYTLEDTAFSVSDVSLLKSMRSTSQIRANFLNKRFENCSIHYCRLADFFARE